MSRGLIAGLEQSAEENARESCVQNEDSETASKMN